MHTSTEPQLAPPGAGLPFPENLIARILLGLKRATGTPEAFVAEFVSERENIRRLIDGQSPERLARRALIARPRGLEDSSRCWSILMTLDHLRIVHHAFIGVLESLSNEKVPPGAASTAAVKPDPEVAMKVLQSYEKSCDSLLATIGRIKNFKTLARYPHPWFGPMDAHGWLALAGGHLRIHRVQIERIFRELEK